MHSPPVPFRCSPLEHETHASRAADGASPSGHVRHAVAPKSSATHPSGHSRHACAVVFSYAPRSQMVHCVRATSGPTAFVAHPSGHSAQAAAPRSEKRSSAHHAHVPGEASSSCLPASHGVHVVRSGGLTTEPGPHWEHAVLPEPLV